MAAGSEGGTYEKLASCLADRAILHEVEIQALATGGSVENIQLLESGKAQFALVQSDVAHQAAIGDVPFDKPIGRLTLVASVYTEAVQLLVRSRLYLVTPDQLKGKIISLGPKGSGTMELRGQY